MAWIKKVLPDPWGPASRTDLVNGVLMRISSDPFVILSQNIILVIQNYNQ